MHRRNYLTIVLIFLLGLTLSCSTQKKEEAAVVSSSDYNDLISLFQEFREFQKPELINGLPDYSKAIPEAAGCHRSKQLACRRASRLCFSLGGNERDGILPTRP